VIQKLLRAGRKGTRVIYVPGNHDEFISGFHGHYGAVEVMPRAIHVTADGRRLLVMHGHELDTVVQSARWLAFIGDIGYTFLLKLNGPVNLFRRLFGLGYWSLSAAVKKSVKEAVNFIGAFEEGLVRFAKDEHCVGVVCGHIHTPVIREFDGIGYFNTGDWVESTSAVLEDFSGKLELVTQFEAQIVQTLPVDAGVLVNS
jgi:UDP-2,3-diacylglucosamine pyrophosphatase LpxH